MPNTTKTHLLIDDKSSFTTSLGRALQLGLSNFWRNKFLSLATITVMAIILFIFNTILAINFIATQALQNISQNVDLVVYLRDDVAFAEAQNVVGSLEKIEGVKSVKYTSKEEGLSLMAKTHPDTVEFLKKFNLPNPLPPRISVIVNKPEDYQKVQSVLEQNDVKQFMKNYVTPGGSEESVILNSVGENLLNIQKFVRQIIFWVILVFVIGGTLVVINAIQLTIYTRRQEVYIMRLVGATPNFIRLPFLLEGFFYSISAVLGSFVFLYLLGKNIQIENTSLWNFYENLQLGKVFLAEISITIVIGLISSTSAVEQYLKKKFSVNA